MISSLRSRLLAAALALAATMSARAAVAEPLIIHVGYAAIGVDNRPYSEGTSAATARAGDYLETEFKVDPNVRIQWHFFKGAGPEVNEAIANKQLDFAYQGDLPAIIGRANGLKTKLLLASGAHKPTYFVAPADSSITGVKDLRGKKVALQRGTNSHLSAIKILQAYGLTERDLQVLNMDSATAGAALAAKEIDAAVGDTPLISLVERGIGKVVYTSKGDDPRYGRYAHVLVTEAFEQAHPDLTARVVKAFVRAAYWSSLEENREALLELWSSKSGTKVSVLREFFAGETLKYRNTPLIDDLFRDQYRLAAEASKTFGLLRRDVELAGWYDTRYLDAALKELGLERFWPPFGADGKPLGS